ncbi:uncharacterized protein L969DRAFT_92953 [Mixia osmundae IAM 14324]|uniref:Arrestin C-terminal-like domain-containing protein n=1 Tax=Mixia osmundae (strain CBS 9802 / IAM 14324 / JCM 22182 / KY 12970) TaxID=764103 RepID=G7DTW0_MIXOS|nr:uncharacterized protein L969DRAFT_92953 [Mixia osmundae IAM 14324]KEI41734.1 hypothetical protein L969DRAFT_92953 [Mixia osmundae IAM 14324]GAA94020.1 hypothetical protein E5Q_00667 [Mixia osmundae IAM 14324]
MLSCQQAFERPFRRRSSFALDQVRTSSLQARATAKLAEMLFDVPKLKLAINPPMLFLHPTDPIARHTEPSEDTILQGEITLTLPKSRDLKDGLEVKLIITADLYVPDRPHDRAILWQQKLVITPGALDKGTHVFAYTFVVPASVPCHERCRHGKIISKVTVNARSMGALGSDLTAERYCQMISNPAGPTDAPPGLTLNIEEYTDELGPYNIAVTAEHLTISGLVLFSLSLPSPPTDVTLMSVSAYIDQAFELTPLRYFVFGAPAPPANKILHPATIRRPLIRLDGVSEHAQSDASPTTVPVPDLPRRVPSALALNGYDDEDDTAERFATELAEAARNRNRSVSQHRRASASPAGSRGVSPHATRPSSPTHEYLANGGPSLSANARRGRELKRAARNASIGPHLADLDASEEYSIKHVSRIPNDNLLRPSTQPGTQTPIRITHELAIEVRYLNAQNKPRVLKIKKAISIASCCCMLESLVLPVYAAKDPRKGSITTTDDVQNIMKNTCICGYSLNKMLEEEADWMRLEVMSDSLVTDVERAWPKPLERAT